MKRLKFFVFFLITVGCVEPYSFVIHQEINSIVVEGYISDKSYQETLQYPSDGRYFTVKVSSSGDVTNARPVMISGAGVQLKSDQGEQWMYQESFEKPGVYSLLDDNFKAVKGVKYKIQITLSGDDVYESTWETLPVTDVPEIGSVSFTEMEHQQYNYRAGVKIIETVKGITTNIEVPENPSGDRIFYRWKFTPIWIYNATLASSVSPNYKCWVDGIYYLTNYQVHVDNTGGYSKDLFFMETVDNERIYEDLSVLITQFASSERNYTFWREMQEQVQSGTFRDSPPFNLQTNIQPLNGDKIVSGYFGVIQEQAKRWYFNRHDLSYPVVDRLYGDCLNSEPTPPECLDCREYVFGIPSNKRPVWWRN